MTAKLREGLAQVPLVTVSDRSIPSVRDSSNIPLWVLRIASQMQSIVLFPDPVLFITLQCHPVSAGLRRCKVGKPMRT